jgi:hypothetical protein
MHHDLSWQWSLVSFPSRQNMGSRDLSVDFFHHLTTLEIQATSFTSERDTSPHNNITIARELGV